MNLFFKFFSSIFLGEAKKPKDFSAQFDQSCITFTPTATVCKNHGPIKFIREDFSGCIECNDKWRSVVYPKKQALIKLNF